MGFYFLRMHLKSTYSLNLKNDINIPVPDINKLCHQESGQYQSEQEVHSKAQEGTAENIQRDLDLDFSFGSRGFECCSLLLCSGKNLRVFDFRSSCLLYYTC